MSLTLEWAEDYPRRCGGCTLCCRLLPTKELNKPANTRCAHQRMKGCAIYDRRPFSCAMWACRWLVKDDTDDMKRPDRAHYVIDIAPDYVTVRNNETGDVAARIGVVQVWADPRHPGVEKDAQLRAYAVRRAAEGWALLIRYGNERAVFLMAPCQLNNHEWVERSSNMEMGPEHSMADIAATLSQVTGEDYAEIPTRMLRRS